jgi:hypothetical protein
VSPARAEEYATQQFWLRTSHVRVPAAVTSSGASSSNSKYCGANDAPAARRANVAVAIWDRGSRSSYGIASLPLRSDALF